VQKEGRDDVDGEIIDQEPIDTGFALFRDEWQEQAEGIAVALLRILRYAALVNQMLRQKATNPIPNRSMISH
jgi:hypothetical protein